MEVLRQLAGEARPELPRRQQHRQISLPVRHDSSLRNGLAAPRLLPPQCAHPRRFRAADEPQHRLHHGPASCRHLPERRLHQSLGFAQDDFLPIHRRDYALVLASGAHVAAEAGAARVHADLSRRGFDFPKL